MQLLMTGHMKAEGCTECHSLHASLVNSIVRAKQDCQQCHIAVTPLCCCCPPAQQATPKGLPLSPAAAQVGQGLRQHLQTVKPSRGICDSGVTPVPSLRLPLLLALLRVYCCCVGCCLVCASALQRTCRAHLLL